MELIIVSLRYFKDFLSDLYHTFKCRRVVSLLTLTFYHQIEIAKVSLLKTLLRTQMSYVSQIFVNGYIMSKHIPCNPTTLHIKGLLTGPFSKWLKQGPRPNDPLSSHEDKLAISFRLFSQVITKFIVRLSAEVAASSNMKRLVIPVTREGWRWAGRRWRWSTTRH